MALKKPPSSKRSIREHTCIQEVVIARLNYILVGNGHPEDGLAFQVRLFVKNQEAIEENLSKINGTVVEALEAASRAASALELYKVETANYEAGKQASKDSFAKRSSLKWMKVFQTIMIIAAMVGLGFTTYFGFVNSQKNAIIEKRVDNLGVPVVTRGGQIKFFPNDFVNDTIPSPQIPDKK